MGSERRRLNAGIPAELSQILDVATGIDCDDGIESGRNALEIDDNFDTLGFGDGDRIPLGSDGWPI